MRSRSSTRIWRQAASLSAISRTRAPALLTCLGVLVLGLASCAATPPNPADTPAFSGPWAQELKAAYDRSTNQLARGILRDGVITESEIAEIKNQQVSCLEGLGFTVFELNTDGSANIRPPQEPGDSVDEITNRSREGQTQCEAETNWSTVAFLYSEMRRNPENQDGALLMANCLVEAGLEPQGYTADQYMADLETGVFLPYLENQETPEGQKFKACNMDPLHLKHGS